jgi:aspartate-semialdehyde dehydrogenase
VPVFSTASAYRYEPDVPILVPGVNPEHAALLRVQQRRRGWRGFIAPGPNCTTTGLVICLRPLHDAFGLRRVIMTSLQAVSGAGRSPGVLALDIVDNVIPYIAKEEEKVELETRKILGQLAPAVGAADGTVGEIQPLPLGLSCTCTRVPVLDGHTETVYVATEKPAPLAAVRQALLDMGQGLRELGLPSLPAQLIAVREELNRPQPRLDRDTGGFFRTM